MTKVLVLDRRTAHPAAIDQVAHAIRQGLVVAVPTECTYLLAARHDLPAAVNRLPSDQSELGIAYTIGVAEPAQAEAFGGSLPPAGTRMAARYWPGPLAMVLPFAMSDHQQVAVRVIADPLTRDIIRRANVAVALVDGVRRGEPWVVDGAAAQRRFAEADWVLDCGPTPLQEPATVISVATEALAIRRTGVIATDMLLRTAMLNVCFVCTGNICRSPMAVGLLRQLVAEDAERVLGTDYTPTLNIYSAGTHAQLGSPPTPEAVQALKVYHADHWLKGATAQQISARGLAQMHEIWVMARAHLEPVRRLAPPTAHVALLDPDGLDVSDPYGGTLDDYYQTARRLKELLLTRYFRSAFMQRHPLPHSSSRPDL